MRLADNLDRHKISDEFEFRPDRTIYYGVTFPIAQKNAIFDLVQSIACLVLIKTFWNLQIAWTGIKAKMSLNSSQIGPLTLGILAL